MKLLFAQHGTAHSEDENPDRPLTTDGMAETRNVARSVAAAGLAVDRVWHSGKLRARQTADLFAESLGGRVEERDDLGPADDPAAAVEAAEATGDSVLLVGHKPFMERLPALLLTGDADATPVEVTYAGLGVLQGSGDEWSLAAYLPPSLV
jgi:phosphohistidine phosphatase